MHNMAARGGPVLKPECCAKLVALRADLAALRSKEPNMHVVVYTQFVKSCRAVEMAVRQDGFTVLRFDGTTAAVKRDQLIRVFQAGLKPGASPRPTVMVITMRSGNVGLTLTAASRVYLLEPCMDPAAELQAAGRVHRLGQMAAVHVKKFCYKDTIEERIVALQKKVAKAEVSLADGYVSKEAIAVLLNGRRELSRYW